MMLQQQYFSGDPVSLSTHLIHSLDWNGCDVRMEMYDGWGGGEISERGSEMVIQ